MGNYGAPKMKSSITKRSVVLDGHKTSVSLEDVFWNDLKEIADNQQTTLSKLVSQIDEKRQQANLSSAIRLYVFEHIRTRGLLRDFQERGKDISPTNCYS